MGIFDNNLLIIESSLSRFTSLQRAEKEKLDKLLRKLQEDSKKCAEAVLFLNQLVIILLFVLISCISKKCMLLFVYRSIVNCKLLL